MTNHPSKPLTTMVTSNRDNLAPNQIASFESMATDVLSTVRNVVEVLRNEFRQQTPQQQQHTNEIPLYKRMETKNIPQIIRSIQDRTKSQDVSSSNDESDKDDSALEVERRRVLSNVALPLANLLANVYQVLDALPQQAKVASEATPNHSGSRRRRNRPTPPVGMLSIQDYTDVACLLEFIVCTGILPYFVTNVILSNNQNSSNSNNNYKDDNSLIEDRLRNKLPKSLAGRIPKDALRWGSSSATKYFHDNYQESLPLLVTTTEAITRVVVLDRFRPMLLPRHLVDIYGACFKIEYIATIAKLETIGLVGSNHYRTLGLSLPQFYNDNTNEHSNNMVVVDPTLRALAYQTLLASCSEPKLSNAGGKTKEQSHGRYLSFLQKRVSELLTDLATTDLSGLSAILTVFVPMASSSTDQASLMSGASQRLGRTLAAMTASLKDNSGNNLQGRLCQQFLELLVMVYPKEQEMATNNGLPPRSMAVIQTAWAFFEHLSNQTKSDFVLSLWASRLLVHENSSTDIHKTIRQIGALCTVVPPHSKSPIQFLRQAAAVSVNDGRHDDSTILGQLLRIAMLQSADNTTSPLQSQASQDAEQTLLLLTHVIYTGSSDKSISSRDEKEEEAAEKATSVWISALGPTRWDLAGKSYAHTKADTTKGGSLETLSVQTRRPLLEPTPVEEFAASVQATTARADFFVEKILLVLAPPSAASAATEEGASSNLSLQGFPSQIFRFLLRQYLSREDSHNMRLIATVLLPVLCEKCSQEQLLFGSHRDNASSLLLLIRQVLTELVEEKSSNADDDDDGHRHEFLKSIAGILTSLLIALMEVGSKSRSSKEEQLLQTFLPILNSLSTPASENCHVFDEDDRKDGAAMADMAAYAMSLIASRQSSTTINNNKGASKSLLSPEERLQNILNEAKKDLESTQAPIRAKGMVSLGRLARGFSGSLTKEQKVPSLIQEIDQSSKKKVGGTEEAMTDWIDRVLELSIVALGDNESYVFLAAIQTIVAIGDLHPNRILPKVASAIVRSEVLGFGSSDTSSAKMVPIQLSQEQVIKLAEALMFIIRRRAVTDEYVPILVNQMLRGGTQNMASSNKLPGNSAASASPNQHKDYVRIQRETNNYFATGQFQNEEKTSIEPDDNTSRTKQEVWEEQDIRLKTGGPIFDFEEAEVVRSLRISILSELVASATAQALVPYLGILVRLAIEALHLNHSSRIILRSSALLIRELYARLLGEATQLTYDLKRIDNVSAKSYIPISIALVKWDEKILSAIVQTLASGKTLSKDMIADSTVMIRCQEALELRNQAEESGVFVAAKLILEEQHMLEELPTLFHELGSSASANITATKLQPIDTKRNHMNETGSTTPKELMAKKNKMSSSAVSMPAKTSVRETVATTTNYDSTIDTPIIEEDWSCHLAATSDGKINCAKDSLGMTSNQEENFAYYDKMMVPLSATSRENSKLEPQNLVMEIRCMDLTPLDMLDLSNGANDATGKRVWMGAMLFLESMVREIMPPQRSNHTINSSLTATRDRQLEALKDLRRTLFHKKKILELGSGTGAALIAIGLAGTINSNNNEEQDDDSDSARTLIRPSHLTLTDNDTDILSLCKINCDRNFRHQKGLLDYRVGHLDWEEFCTKGQTINNQASDTFFLDSKGLSGHQDTIVATDVIYDLATIPILFATAEGLLKEGGFFVLAHVPRASIECEPSRIRDSIEEVILSEAIKNGFQTSFQDCEELKSWDVLFRGDNFSQEDKYDHVKDEYRNKIETHSAILRPSTLAQLWENGYKNQSPEDQNNKLPVLTASSHYNYEEFETCGASIMVFVKKAQGQSTSA